MSNARSNSLHEKLSVEVRQQVERDLVEQPPGRETYAKVHEHYGLAELGISVKAVERYGGYLRALHRNQWIREVGDSIVGEDLKGRVESVIRSRLYEAVTTQDAKIGDLMKAAITEKALREGAIKSEEWALKKPKLEAALRRSVDEEKRDPAMALENFREAVQQLYGITPPAAR